MFAALDITAPGAPIETYLTLRLGEMQFGSLDTSIVVLSLAAALVSALNLWRIGTREDREKRLLGAVRRYLHHGGKTAQIRRTPWYQRLGAEIAVTKIIGTAKQESLLSALVAAGIKGHGHLAALITAKFCFGAALVPLCWMLLEWRQSFADAPTTKLIILAAPVFSAGIAPRSSSRGWPRAVAFASKTACPMHSIFSSSAPRPALASITRSSK